MKVLVTGATGFIGRHVVEALYAEGNQITATSRSRNRDHRQWFVEHNISYIPFDIHRLSGDLFSLFNKPDCVIHLAWDNLPNYNEMFHIETNLYDNYFFLKNLIEHGLKHLVVTGTCLEYGMQSGPLHEELVPEPTTPYGIAKNALRTFLVELQKKSDFIMQWVRLFYTYGDGQNQSAILSQLDAALQRNDKQFNMSGGDQLRDYLPVEKVSELIVKVSSQDKIVGIINCCSGIPISIRSLVEQHLNSKGRTIKLNLGYYPYPEYEPMAYWGDNSKMNAIFERG